MHWGIRLCPRDRQTGRPSVNAHQASPSGCLQRRHLHTRNRVCGTVSTASQPTGICAQHTFRPLVKVQTGAGSARCCAQYIVVVVVVVVVVVSFLFLPLYCFCLILFFSW